MSAFRIRGKVIDAENRTKQGLKVLAFDDDPWLNPDDFLGEAMTGSDGSFEIRFDSSKFAAFWEFLEGSPDVYVILRDAEGSDILRTRVEQTGKEIEYHVKLDESQPDPMARDIYAGNVRRLQAMLGEVGAIIGTEQSLNLDVLANGDLAEELRKRLDAFVNGFDERMSNFDHLMAALNGLVTSTLEERRLGTIGYDGPQVPRLPRREAHGEVIIWPRKEAFRWESSTA